jgi:hypothetical protein
VIQLNKRDLPDAISVALLKRNLNLPNSDIDGMGFPLVYEAIAGNEVNPEGGLIQSIFSEHDLILTELEALETDSELIFCPI